MHKFEFLIVAGLALFASACQNAAEPPAPPEGAPDPEAVSEAPEVSLGEPGESLADGNLSGENTDVKFVGKKKDGQHEGGFENLSGNLEFNPEDLASSKLEVVIDTTSLWSDNEELTNHLKNLDFFAVNAYPQAKFVASEFKADESDPSTYTISGDLTIRGKTATITFPAKISKGEDGLSLTSEFDLSRSQIGITYGEGQIHDDVQMTISAQVSSSES